jgi:hypothetical protein
VERKLVPHSKVIGIPPGPILEKPGLVLFRRVLKLCWTAGNPYNPLILGTGTSCCSSHAFSEWVTGILTDRKNRYHASYALCPDRDWTQYMWTGAFEGNTKPQVPSTRQLQFPWASVGLQQCGETMSYSPANQLFWGQVWRQMSVPMCKTPVSLSGLWVEYQGQSRMRSGLQSPHYLMLPLGNWAAGEFGPVSSAGVLGPSERMSWRVASL